VFSYYNRIKKSGGMMNKELIEKINSLAKKQREVGLSEEEKEEQQRLRQEYLRLFRMEFKKILDSIETVD